MTYLGQGDISFHHPVIMSITKHWGQYFNFASAALLTHIHLLGRKVEKKNIGVEKRVLLIMEYFITIHYKMSFLHLFCAFLCWFGANARTPE